MEAIFSNAQVRLISQWVLTRIKTRTVEGIDADGKEFKEYSTKVFAIPIGATTKKVMNILLKSGAAVIRNIGGKPKLVVTKGYIPFKKAHMSGTAWNGEVNLTLTGAMLRDMNVISVDKNSFTVGWANTELAERASFNIARGREFLGLSPQDLSDPRLLELLSSGIEFVD